MSDPFTSTNTNDYKVNNTHLEPRVAKLEVGLDRLTDDVRSLAAIVRDQGSNVEKQLNDLTIAVTQAAGPRKTDWSVIISAVLLVMAIGSAAFWPLNQVVQESKVTIEQIRNDINEHKQLQLHPVGVALVQRLETQLQDHARSNEKQMDIHVADSVKMHSLLQKHFDERILSLSKINELELSALKEKVQLHDDRLYGRVVKLEDRNSTETEREKDELQMWRLKAMGVSVVPTVNTHTHDVVEQSTIKK